MTPDGKETKNGEIYLYAPRCGEISKEFARKNVWMTGDLTFGRVVWTDAWGRARHGSCGNKMFLAWRIFVGCFALGICIWSWAAPTQNAVGFWLAYLTHWVLLMNALTLISSSITTVMIHAVVGLDSPRGEENVPWYAKLAWIGSSISIPGGFIVVVLYWTLTPSNTVLTRFVHGVVWAVIMIDHLLGKQPYVLVQFVWVTLFSFLYAIWLVIFYFAGLTDYRGNRYVYSILDYGTKPATAAGLSFGLALVAMPLISMGFWFLNFIRKQGIRRENNAVVSA